MNDITNIDGSTRHKYRGFLALRYREYHAQHPEVSIHDHHELQTEFLKLAVETWLTGAILPIRDSLEQWSQVTIKASLEGVNLVKQITQRFIELTKRVLVFRKKISSAGITPFQSAVPVIREWITEIESVSEALGRTSATLDQEGQFLLSNWFLPRLTELRWDMIEVLHILEETVE